MKQHESSAKSLAVQSMVAIGAAAVGSLVTAALNGPLPVWALVAIGLVSVVFALFVFVPVSRSVVAWLTPRWRRRLAGSQIRGDVDALIAGLLEVTSPSFVKSVSNIFHRLLQPGLIDANTASAFNAHVMTLSRWIQVTREQLRQGTLTPLMAFQVLGDSMGAYVDLCNTVSRLVEAREGSAFSDGLRESVIANLRRDWHGIATYANDLANQYRLVARRVNARLESDQARVYFDTVADWS